MTRIQPLLRQPRATLFLCLSLGGAVKVKTNVVFIAEGPTNVLIKRTCDIQRQTPCNYEGLRCTWPTQ